MRAEQDRPDVLSKREAWFEGELDLDPHRLVFIDETGASTKMARLHGRAPRGERLRPSGSLAYTEQMLVPTLRPGDVVILDNLPAHKRGAVRQPAQRFCSSAILAGLQPDRERFRQAKDAPVQAPARTVDHLWNVLGDCLDAFTPAECANRFAAAGYDAY